MMVNLLYIRLRMILIKKLNDIRKIVEQISLTAYLIDTEFDDSSAK